MASPRFVSGSPSHFGNIRDRPWQAEAAKSADRRRRVNEFREAVAAAVADSELVAAYGGLRLATRAAVTIFMDSFSGGTERGTHIGEIKRHAAALGTPSAAVVDAVERLRDPVRGLHYLWRQGDRYFFSTEANLTRIVLQRMETLATQERLLEETERGLLEGALHPKGTVFERATYLWPESEVPGNIQDLPELTLVVLRGKDEGLMQRTREQKDGTPRVYGNALVFLYPSEAERPGFRHDLLCYLAYRDIQADAARGTLKLSEEQRKEVGEELGNLQDSLPRKVRMLYRLVAVPVREGFREIDLGVPTVGDGRSTERGTCSVAGPRVGVDRGRGLLR